MHAHNFLEPKFSRAQWYSTDQKNFRTKNIFWLKFFRILNSLRPKILMKSKKISTQNFFRVKIFSDPKFFRLKFFLTQKLFAPKFFSDLKFYRNIYFFNIIIIIITNNNRFINLEKKQKVVEIGTKHLNDMHKDVKTKSRAAVPLSTVHNVRVITFPFLT